MLGLTAALQEDLFGPAQTHTSYRTHGPDFSGSVHPENIASRPVLSLATVPAANEAGERGVPAAGEDRG